MAERDKWQLVAWAVAAVVVVLAAVRMLAPAGGGGNGAAAPAVRIDEGDRAGRRTGAGEGLFVHVAGAVRRPGLIRVPRGSRVAVALERAGGPLRRADLTAVNLAAPLEDGQQVVVPRAGSAPGAGAAGAGAAGAPNAGPTPATPGASGGNASISLATATVEQLDSLDGIGPTLARRIVEQRQRSGGFRSLEELREVDGIGDKRLAALKAALRP